MLEVEHKNVLDGTIFIRDNTTVWTVRKVDKLFANILSNFDKSPNKSLVLLDAIFDPSGSSDLIQDVFPISED